MGVAHKGAISFGLVSIPVELYVATEESGIAFNQIHKDCKERIRYKKTCPPCNIEDVNSKDIVKGYEYEKDKYVLIDDDDFEKIKTQKDRNIYILHFVDINEIDPIYFEKSYYAVPNGSDKAYALLKIALESEHKVAIAKTVIGTKEHLLTIRPTNDCILMDTMFYYNEVRAVPKPMGNIDINPAELGMAKTLINNMTSNFNPELYKDEYVEKVKDLIQQKIEGKEVIRLDDKDETPSNVIDIMEALKQSVEKTKKAQ